MYSELRVAVYIVYQNYINQVTKFVDQMVYRL